MSLGRLQLASGRLAAPRIALDLEAELLAFLDRAEACAFDGADVDEDILAAIIGLDEAEALGGVEPFHGADCHKYSLSGVSSRALNLGTEI